jgi:hypothetical protein
MIAEVPENKPNKEKGEAVADNARKFIVGPIDRSFLEERATSSTRLMVDWLEIDEGNGIETKLAYKEDLRSGNIKILLITKTTDKDGNRKTTREDVTEEEYERRKESLTPTNPHLEKMRWEFTYVQNDIPFPVKYDEFADSELRMLEVDDSDTEEGIRFDSADFPIELREVSDDPNFTGSRVVEIIKHPDRF